jgi:hypothetical protein
MLELFIDQQWPNTLDMVCKKVVVTMLNQTMIFSSNKHKTRRRLGNHIEQVMFDNSSNIDPNNQYTSNHDKELYPLHTYLNVTVITQSKSSIVENQVLYTLQQQSTPDGSTLNVITDVLIHIVRENDAQLLIHNLQYDKSIRSYFMNVHQLEVVTSGVLSSPTLSDNDNHDKPPNAHLFLWTVSASFVFCLIIALSRYTDLHKRNKVEDSGQSYQESAPPPTFVVSSLMRSSYGGQYEEESSTHCSQDDCRDDSSSVEDYHIFAKVSNWISSRYCTRRMESSDGSVKIVDNKDNCNDNPTTFHTIVRNHESTVKASDQQQSQYFHPPKPLLKDYLASYIDDIDEHCSKQMYAHRKHDDNETITNVETNDDDMSSVSSLRSQMVYLQLANVRGTNQLSPMNELLPIATEEDSMYCFAIVTITAPPGRLGMVIDTTNKGPLVYHVLDDSPLVKKIFPGDFIIGLNNVDTRSMSSNQLSDMISQAIESHRILTVMREMIYASKEEEMTHKLSFQKIVKSF